MARNDSSLARPPSVSRAARRPKRGKAASSWRRKAKSRNMVRGSPNDAAPVRQTRSRPALSEHRLVRSRLRRAPTGPSSPASLVPTVRIVSLRRPSRPDTALRRAPRPGYRPRPTLFCAPDGPWPIPPSARAPIMALVSRYSPSKSQRAPTRRPFQTGVSPAEVALNRGRAVHVHVATADPGAPSRLPPLGAARKDVSRQTRSSCPLRCAPRRRSSS